MSGVSVNYVTGGSRPPNMGGGGGGCSTGIVVYPPPGTRPAFSLGLTAPSWCGTVAFPGPSPWPPAIHQACSYCRAEYNVTRERCPNCGAPAGT